MKTINLQKVKKELDQSRRTIENIEKEAAARKQKEIQRQENILETLRASIRSGEASTGDPIFDEALTHIPYATTEMAAAISNLGKRLGRPGKLYAVITHREERFGHVHSGQSREVKVTALGRLSEKRLSVNGNGIIIPFSRFVLFDEKSSNKERAARQEGALILPCKHGLINPLFEKVSMEIFRGRDVSNIFLNERFIRRNPVVHFPFFELAELEKILDAATESEKLQGSGI